MQIPLSIDDPPMISQSQAHIPEACLLESEYYAQTTRQSEDEMSC